MLETPVTYTAPAPSLNAIGWFSLESSLCLNVYTPPRRSSRVGLLVAPTTYTPLATVIAYVTETPSGTPPCPVYPLRHRQWAAALLPLAETELAWHGRQVLAPEAPA